MSGAAQAIFAERYQQGLKTRNLTHCNQIIFSKIVTL